MIPDFSSDEVKGWIGAGKVVGSARDLEHGCLWVVTKSDGKYNLLRFFFVGGSTQCSADILREPQETFLVKMMRKLVPVG